jgi:hypothetical protein
MTQGPCQRKAYGPKLFARNALRPTESSTLARAMMAGIANLAGVPGLLW